MIPCTAPRKGHTPGSAEEQKCPACRAQKRRKRLGVGGARPSVGAPAPALQAPTRAVSPGPTERDLVECIRSYVGGKRHQYVSSGWGVGRDIASHPAMSDELAELLLGSGSAVENVGYGFLSNWNRSLPDDVMETVFAHESEYAEASKFLLAKKQRLPQNIIADQRENGSAYVLEGLVANRATPVEDVLYILDRVRREGLRAKICIDSMSRNDMPTEVLTEYAGHKDKYVRAAVAGNRRTPEDVLRTLAHDKESTVRRSAAKNESLPDDVLEEMFASGEKTLWVLKRIASATSSADVVAELSRHDENSVRDAAMRNPLLSKEDLGRLLSDGNKYKNSTEASTRVIGREFGITNPEALEYLWAEQWWTMDSASDSVVIADAMYPSPGRNK